MHLITTPARTPRLVLAAAAVTAVLCSSAAWAQTEIVVKNDSLPDVLPPTGVNVGFQIYFNTNEEVNVWLTAPCTGTIVAIDILWMCQLPQGPAPSVENAITLFQPGTYPARSNTPLNNQVPTPTTPADLVGPVFQTGNGMYEFRFLDQNNTVPLSVPVTMGQTFVVSFEFGEDHAAAGATDPTIPIDTNGTVLNHNGIFGLPGGFLCWNSQGTCPIPGANIPGAGDFIVRVKMVCDTVTGACCLPSGTCQNGVIQAVCTSQGGTFQGANSTCAGVTCPQPTGACCVNGNCSIMTQTACTKAGGTYLGNNSTCTATSCNGACCVPSTQQCVNTSQSTCALAGGTFHANTNCTTFVCFPLGACCLENGQCSAGPMSPAQCAALGGTFAGNNTTCATANCQPPIGACCFGTGCAPTVTQASCAALGGTWAGPNSLCTTAFICPYCPADINHSGVVNVDDLLAVIGAWGPCINCPADVAPPPFGDNSVNVNDLLLIIGNWGACH